MGRGCAGQGWVLSMVVPSQAPVGCAIIAESILHSRQPHFLLLVSLPVLLLHCL